MQAVRTQGDWLMEQFVKWLRRLTEAAVGRELATLISQILREAIALAIIEVIIILSLGLSGFLTGALGVGKDELHYFVVFAHEALIVLGLLALVIRAIFHYLHYILGDHDNHHS